MADREHLPAKLPTQTVAGYAGAISRFLDLADVPVEVKPGEPKTATEFEAFNRHLDRLAAERRKLAEVRF